ncbi:MAG: NAD(P)-dependent oxidoreductase [Ardenticatenaceae bacterium]
MKVLVADQFSEKAQIQLRHEGFEVAYSPDLQGAALQRALADSGADVLVVRSTRVTAPMLESIGSASSRQGKLGLVIRAGAGYNTIDVQTAKALGIRVSNCPGMNANAVAELAFGLMVALDRRIPENVADLRRGRWNKIGYSNARGLFGQMLGLIGLGYIGRAMIPRAKAFGMPLVAWSRSLTAERARELGVEMKASPLEVASSADIVSLHVALTADTRLLVDDKFLDAMRPGAMLINTARSEVVDEVALASAVKDRGIRAGVDVFEGEPASGTGEVSNPLFQLDGVIGTHHIGGATTQAHTSIADEVVRIILEFRDTGVPPNQVV